jgi:hypothetical protein
MKNRVSHIGLVLLLAGALGFTAFLIIKKISGKQTNGAALAESLYVPQEVSTANFVALREDFQLIPEQDEDAPLKVLDARVHVISGDEYQRLTSQLAFGQEIISNPRVVLQNVSNKTIVGITLMVVDKAAGIKQGLYMKDQSIKPGQLFTIRSENFVRVGGNPAAKPKFWLEASDKSKVTVRVVAFFADGSMWANKKQRY